LTPERRASVFVSYARSDGEALARALRERLATAGIALWRDREAMEGGRDWWLQITEALDHVEFMVMHVSQSFPGMPVAGIFCSGVEKSPVFLSLSKRLLVTMWG